MNNKIRIGLMLLSACAAQATVAQQTDRWDNSLELTLSAEGTAGNGDFAATLLSSNRHGILSNNANNGYGRATLEAHQGHNGWSLTEGVDVEWQAEGYSSFYLQQCYVEVSRTWLTLMAGSRELEPLLRNRELSSGSTIWSGNSRPVPQVLLKTTDWQVIPGLNHWLEIKADMGYGKFIDDAYLKHRYYDLYVPGRTGMSRSTITTDVWYHHKAMALRTDSRKPWVFTLGVEHAVQFGGTSNYNESTKQYEEFRTEVKAKDFFKAFIPQSGDNNSAIGDQKFMYGNHIGNISLMLDYKPAAGQHLSLYVENLFEDGSSMVKRNGWDGLWGLEYSNDNANSWLQGVVMEYLQTTDQSGPIHWAPSDHATRPIDGEARGADNYYNNFFYSGYAHYGMACGSPLLKSPAYNADGYLKFTDTRVMAWHIGAHGTLCDSRGQYNIHTTWRTLLAYSNSYGIPNVPSLHIGHNLSALAEIGCKLDSWQLKLTMSMDRGSMYGDNYSAAFSISKHFKLL